MGNKNYKTDNDKRSARGQRMKVETRKEAQLLGVQIPSTEFQETHPNLLSFAALTHVVENFAKLHEISYKIHKNLYQTLFENVHLESSHPLPNYCIKACVYFYVESTSEKILYIGKSSISAATRIYQQLGGSKNNLILSGNFLNSCWEKKINVNQLAIKIIREAKFDVHLIEMTTIGNSDFDMESALESILLQYYRLESGELPPLNSVCSLYISDTTRYF